MGNITETYAVMNESFSSDREDNDDDNDNDDDGVSESGGYMWDIVSTSAQRDICKGYEEDERARFDYDACIVDKITSFNVSHSSLPTETTDKDDDATLDEHDPIL